MLARQKVEGRGCRGFLRKSPRGIALGKFLKTDPIPLPSTLRPADGQPGSGAARAGDALRGARRARAGVFGLFPILTASGPLSSPSDGEARP